MASEKKAKDTTQTAETQPAPAKTKRRPTATYNRAELMHAAGRFKVKPEVVAAAMHLAGKDRMTLAEAEEAIQRFKERKV